MKRFVLIASLISLLFNPLFSQQKYYFKMDTTFKRFSFDNKTGNLNLEKNKNYEDLLNGSSHDLNQFYFKNAEKNYLYGKSLKRSIDSTHSYDNMPIIIPEGNYSMTIIKPDPTIKYNLLIKKP